jgi:hypothetical protein
VDSFGQLYDSKMINNGSPCLFKDHAHIVQSRNEAAAVNLAAAGRAVAESDGVGS